MSLGRNNTVSSSSFLSSFYSLIADFMRVCMAWLSVTLNASCEINLSLLFILNPTLHGCESWQDMMEEGNGWILIYDLVFNPILLHQCCNKPGENLCYKLKNHKGELCKMEGWRDEERKFHSSIPECFCLCCLYCLIQPVCILVNHIRSFLFNDTVIHAVWNVQMEMKPNLSALDTVT